VQDHQDGEQDTWLLSSAFQDEDHYEPIQNPLNESIAAYHDRLNESDVIGSWVEHTDNAADEDTLDLDDFRPDEVVESQRPMPAEEQIKPKKKAYGRGKR
jgi:hypothetical protein